MSSEMDDTANRSAEKRGTYDHTHPIAAEAGNPITKSTKAHTAIGIRHGKSE
jgi:hypothetical protein